MIVKHYQIEAESEMTNKAFDEGSVYYVQDSGHIYIDPVGGSVRVLFTGDPVVLTKTEFDALLAPVPDKIYFVPEDKKIHINHGGTWYSVGSQLSAIPVKVAEGGTGAITAANARKNLDVPSTGDLSTHAANTTHITATERTNWNAAHSHANSAHAPSNAEPNQNAFSNVKVGSTTVAADSKTDTLELVAGSNITLTPDATNDKVTIAAKDTVYTHPAYTAKSSGLYKITVDATGHVSAVTPVVKGDIVALGVPAQDTIYSHPSYTAKSSGLYKITVDATGHVSDATAVVKADITGLGIPAQDTVYTHPAYTAKSSGLYKVTVDNKGHVSATTAVTKSDITALGIPSTNTTYGNMGAATASAAGTSGLVPAPAAGKQASYLRGDGTWSVPTNTTYSNMKGATSSAAGTAGLVPAPAAGKQTSFLRGDGTWAAAPNYDLLKYAEVTLSSSGWSSSAPYTQTITVSGITSSWVPGFPVLVPTGTQAADISAQEALSNLSTIESGSGKLIFTCYKTKPTVNLTIRIPGMISR